MRSQGTFSLSTIQRASLNLAGQGSRGGQGTVYRVQGGKWNAAASGVVYKQYHATQSVNAGVLDSMVAFILSRAPAERDAVIGRSAWPIQVVVQGNGSVCGFIMPRIPDDFLISFRTSRGTTERVPGEFQHLLNDDRFLLRHGIRINDKQRFGLLLDVARALDMFHGHGIAIGDLSPKNLLFSLASSPRSYFIDCDSVTVNRKSVLAQVETPDWDVRSVSREELATPASDRYKFGLLVLRLFAQDQNTRDVSRLPRRVPSGVRRLVEAALGATPASRPSLRDWFKELESAQAGASAKSTSSSTVMQGSTRIGTSSGINTRNSSGQPVTVSTQASTGNGYLWLLALGVVLTVLLWLTNGDGGSVVRGLPNPVVPSSSAAVAESAATEARRAEERRLAERARVVRGIRGVWLNGVARLTIAGDGETLAATYVQPDGTAHNLRAEVLANNRIKLRSEQVGKLVNPFSYWQGDFSQESWLELGPDGSFLSATFEEHPGGRTVRLTRANDLAVAQTQQEAIARTAGSVEPEANAKPAAPLLPVISGDPGIRTTAADHAAAERAAGIAAMLTAMETLRMQVNARWTAAAEIEVSGGPNAYVHAADELGVAERAISEFHGRFGATESSRQLSIETAVKRTALVVACQTENRMNRTRGRAEMPCPPGGGA